MKHKEDRLPTHVFLAILLLICMAAIGLTNEIAGGYYDCR